MKAQSVLGSAALGVGLGTLLLPAAALADTTVSPATTPVGGTVVLTSTCNPKSGDTIFRVTGPDRDQNVRSTTAAASGGLSAELFTAGFTLGTYTVTATCGDGTSSGSATFTVTPIGAAPAGAGAGAGADASGLLAAGGTLVGAAATGALALARRRRRGAAARA
ncbi:hypothetical protein E1258_25135 [Micromonospora sp. KC207]|uniref:hypothetical protein n=1 Tax=Micromonospora sp. KC207 TaxID=2530377 RepID=UPI0010506D77|nr:hypothetical protein [Micromonospora sp. KC207]TDC52517.1 hypothetical protein E1258_25135 [Micromonospora sp. KC207]